MSKIKDFSSISEKKIVKTKPFALIRYHSEYYCVNNKNISSVFFKEFAFFFVQDMMVPIFFGPEALSHLGSGDS
jgi:hypothetical protein